MSFFIGVDLGQVSEATALVVVESNTLEHIRTEEVYERTCITYRSVYRGKDGEEVTEIGRAHV